ncbi:alpha/beta fold hydrolase [Gordonia desulfuricans]|uniref:Alpha/beta fold hydrolase n=1 Tax=Gordonia desulfuricans TaxID=89051 RepID=A0A7K3LJ39_9ACTN|nr:alpha/beta fold hydrolase [Gordonia desulfuricans]NDK88208.1 alpha/beta fold hydrolase [Gordonia desulfuricans]
MVQWIERTVVSGGVALAVFEAAAGPGGPAAPHDDRPVVLLVHGWPDTHIVWDGVAEALLPDARVFAFDCRGLGHSDRPHGISPYRIETLADDVFAVAGEVNTGGRVHLVAHDWGSILSWEAVSRPGADDVFASYTTISGPCLDHVGTLVRENFSPPTRDSLRATALQAIASTYIAVFHLPLVPRLLLSVLGIPRVWREYIHVMDGTPREVIQVAPTFRRDMIAGVAYYRANMLRRLIRPRPRPTRIPVLELINTRDFAIRTTTFALTGRYAENLTRRESATGHWLPLIDPGFVADNVRDHIAAVAPRPADSPNPAGTARSAVSARPS